MVVPQAHALNLINNGLTGTYAIVGSAIGEAKLTDSVSGQFPASWADQHFGTAAVSNATVCGKGVDDLAVQDRVVAFEQSLWHDAAVTAPRNRGVQPTNIRGPDRSR